MLQKLHIHNYAIIDELQIDFQPGLNIITGETGAGKSILMGALNLILGERAGSGVFLHADKKCMVEGIFNVKQSDRLKEFFENNDLDFESEVLVRREVSPAGKSRCFINDTPVNLSQLRLLSMMMVDLNQQFDTQDLGSEDFQRNILDAFAGNGAWLLQLKGKFLEYTKTRKALEALQVQQKEADKEHDYNKFLFDELDELSLKENELEELDAELKLLSNAEGIKQQLSAISHDLNDSEQPLINQLKLIRNKLELQQAYHKGIAPQVQRLSGIVIDLKDIADELVGIENAISYDPERIGAINDRLSAGYKLMKKHAVNDTASLLEIHQQLQQKLDAVLNISSSIEKMEKVAGQQLGDCMLLAEKISENRNKQRKPLAEKVNKLLVQVGMPNALLKIEIKPKSLDITGVDEIHFLFDANKSNRFEPLEKVASGGELSRLMLCIKSLVAQKLELPTLIFDEIDSGISGEAARQVAVIMKGLAEGHQLIAITHQPQIAARASAHFYVFKENRDGRVVTGLRRLSDDERITAIAKMLGGEKPTSAAMENAREMVEN